jgi:putative Mg2+ transporter-C (MgtC) family protein
MADLTTFGLRLLVALLLGSAIGIERQWFQKIAGLRTNALVAVGAAGFVTFGTLGQEGDPGHIAGQVVTGIGFLGAGVILREGINVHGLNTAATLWCSAMVGTLAGGGRLAESALAACFIIFVNLGLRPLVGRLGTAGALSSSAEAYYTVQVTSAGTEEARVRALLLQSLSAAGLGIRQITSEDLAGTPNVVVSVALQSKSPNESALEQIVGRMSLEPYVSKANWRAEADLFET